jgi:hypothetical protein
VTALTELIEERLARTDRGRTAGKRIGRGNGLPGGNRARSHCNDHENRK